MRILFVIGALYLTNFAFLTNAWGQSTCYSVNGQTDKLYTLSVTGSITGVDSFLLTYNSNTLDNVGAAAFMNDTLWFLDEAQLYFIVDPANSTTVLQLSSNDIDNSASTSATAYNGMSFDKDGNLWVVSNDDAGTTNPFLAVISRTTGEIDGSLTPGGTDVIEIGGLTDGEITAIEFDHLTNQLYAAVANGGDKLYQIDLIPGVNYTANAVLVGGMASLGVKGLSMDGDGKLIGSTGNGSFFRIDGNAALWQSISASTAGTDIQTIAFESGTVDYIGISGYVFDDKNLSGVFESDESGRNNVSVFLYIDSDQDGVLDPSETTIKDSANTNINGFYDIRIPYAGNEMYIVVVDVNDYADGVLYDEFKAAINPYNGGSGSAGDFYTGLNFKYHYGLLIYGRVYEDLNKDSVLQNSEDIDVPGLTGIVIELYDDDNCDGTENAGGWLDTVQVDETGEFVFTTSYDGSATSGNAGNLHKDVSGPTDDATEAGGLVNYNATTINVGEDIAAFRFKNLNSLNSNSVIVNARLKLRASGNSSGVVTTKIAFEDVANAAAIANGQTSDLSNRKNNLTSAITWEIVEPWVDGEYYYSPNLADIMQEVISQPGFSLTNSNFMIIITDDNGTGRPARAKDYSGSGNQPELIIDYTDGTGSDCYVLKVNVDGVPGTTVTEGADDYALTFTQTPDTSYQNFGVWGINVPVTWLSFDANKMGDAALLNWATSQEINNDFFTVQHSVDGVNFTDIAVMQGAGNSASAKHYEYIHANPIMGVNYYRIKQTDFNGMWDYSVVRTVNFGGPVGEVTINPNPVVSNVTVQIPETVTGETTITVMDMTGKVILSRTLSEDEINNGTATLDLTSVKTGAYLITVSSATEVYTDRIIKN